MKKTKVDYTKVDYGEIKPGIRLREPTTKKGIQVAWFKEDFKERDVLWAKRQLDGKLRTTQPLIRHLKRKGYSKDYSAKVEGFETDGTNVYLVGIFRTSNSITTDYLPKLRQMQKDVWVLTPILEKLGYVVGTYHYLEVFNEQWEYVERLRFEADPNIEERL